MQTILTAEDDRVLCKRIKKAILRINSAVAVQEVHDAEAAIEVIAAKTVALVITDIRMPKGGGLMVIAYLNAFLPEVPCFVITAYGTSRLKGKLPEDLLHYYDKPFDIETLAMAASAALSRKRGGGYCKGIHLQNFVNMAAADGVTATITVRHPEHNPCKLFLIDGALIHAVSQNDQGESVAISAMSWDMPEYSIQFGVPDGLKRTIKTPLKSLLRIACDCFDMQKR